MNGWFTVVIVTIMIESLLFANFALINSNYKVKISEK